MSTQVAPAPLTLGDRFTLRDAVPVKRASDFSVAMGLATIFAAGLALRITGTNTAFTSADHAALAYQTTFEPGWGWVLRHHYGPLQPMLTKVFAVVVTAFGGTMTERLWRLPMGVVGAVIPLLAFALVNRLGDSRRAAWAAALWTAVLPPLVTDARYLWAYETLGGALALAVLIATFDYVDEPFGRRAWRVGLLLAAYACAHLHVYAVPIVVAMIVLLNPGRPRRSGPGWVRLLRSPGLYLPPLMAIGLLVLAWRRFGEGSVGRLLGKIRGAGPSTEPEAWMNLLVDWRGHFGYAAAVAVLSGMLLAIPAALTLRRRSAALWWWAVLFALPMFVLSAPTGRPTQYLTQASLAATICAAVVIVGGLERSGRVGAARAIILAVTVGLAFGSVDTNLNEGRLASWTGVSAAWGARPADPGYKAAGWFIRRHVPADAVVCTLHDTAGLEAMPAAYYMGRACLAAEDLTAPASRELLRIFETRVDVIVCESDLGLKPDWTDRFTRAATVTRDGQDVLDVYARPKLGLPLGMLQVEACNDRYDRECGVRAIGQPLPRPSKLPTNGEIRETLTKISARTASPRR